MKKVITLIFIFLLLAFPFFLYGKKGNISQEFKGAGIGKEVSEEAKILKDSEDKEKFGEWVRERARERERIEEHKELKKSEKNLNQKGKQKRKRFRREFEKEGNFTVN